MADMPRRKVVIVPSWYPAPECPVNGIFIKDQAECLAQHHHVTALIPELLSWRTFFKSKAGPGISKTQSNGVEEWRIRHRCLPRLSSLPGLDRYVRFQHQMVHHARIFAKVLARGFERYVCEKGLPDIVHAHVIMPAGWAVAELASRYAVKTVLTEHSGPFYVHMRSKEQRQLVEQGLFKLDRVVAVSPYLARTMREFFPRLSVDVLGNVVRTGFFVPRAEPLPRPRRFRFFSLALLCEAKGLQYLLQAANQLVRQGTEGFEIVIGGDGPYRPRLEAMSRQLGIQDRCRFLGLLSREQARNEMQDCDAFVLPSLGETFCLVLAEAMSCGRPVISTRCGGPEFVVPPDCGILTKLRAVGQLAAAMQQLMNERGGQDSPSPAIRQGVCARFGEESFVRNVSAIYERLLETRLTSCVDKRQPVENRSFCKAAIG